MNTSTMTQGTLRERDIVRRLAEKIARIAGEPRMDAIRKRWRDVNALRKPDRAPVWCRPVGCWSEIFPPGSLECADPALRHLEYQFRQTLYKRTIDDDTPVDPFFAVPAVFDVQPANIWGLDIWQQPAPSGGGAWGYDPPLKAPADYERLTPPRFSLDRSESDRRLEVTEKLLAGILPAKLEAYPPLDVSLCSDAANLRGLTPMMLDMTEEPERMHRLMAFLRDAMLAVIDQVEATGLLTPNNNNAMTCSEPLTPCCPSHP